MSLHALSAYYDMLDSHDWEHDSNRKDTTRRHAGQMHRHELIGIAAESASHTELFRAFIAHKHDGLQKPPRPAP